MGEKIFFTWETQVIIMTIVFTLIMISSIVYLCWGISFKEKPLESSARLLIAIFILLAEVSLMTLTPRWAKYDEEGISIKKVIGKKKIAYKDITSIETITPKVISGSVRKRASGGAGGYVGEFKNKTLGLYMMYATEKKDLVLVKCTDEIIVFNCKKRDELVEYAKDKLKTN